MLKELTRETYQVFLPDGTAMNVMNELQSPTQACELLEMGGIIYFPTSPFTRSAEDTAFLLAQNQKDVAYHKNIAYRPLEDRVTGAKDLRPSDAERLRKILGDYSRQTVSFLQQFLAPYDSHWKLDFASYRPIEERGRKMRLHARNDLIHVDSFPTRPIKGDRILRVFENINPTTERVWRTSDAFDTLVDQFKRQRKGPGDLDKEPAALVPEFLMKALGLKLSSRSPYDNWMSSFHNFLKENAEFQENCRKSVWKFPPGSAWMVYTDMVSHSVLSGQFALEQTFIVDQQHMVLPEKAPINILRRVYG